MKLKKRIILVGKAGSGKDHFRNYLNKQGLKVSVSKTTRLMREGEIPGYTYDYITEEKFMELYEFDKFHEHVEFNGWGYGTLIDSHENDDVFIYTPSGVDTLSRKDLKESVIVYFDIATDVRINRLAERSDSDTIERRIAADGVDFMDFSEWDIRVTNPEYDAELLLTTISTYMEV